MHSHHITVDVGGRTSTFVCLTEGDFSGPVRIVSPPGYDQGVASAANGERCTVTVPFAVMKELVGRWLGAQRVAAIEAASGSDLLDAEA